MALFSIRDLLIDKFGAKAIADEKISGLQGSLIIHPDYMIQVCQELRDNENTYFDFLSCLTGVDYGADENKFAVVFFGVSGTGNTL